MKAVFVLFLTMMFVGALAQQVPMFVQEKIDPSFAAWAGMLLLSCFTLLITFMCVFNKLDAGFGPAADE